MIRLLFLGLHGRTKGDLCPQEPLSLLEEQPRSMPVFFCSIPWVHPAWSSRFTAYEIRFHDTLGLCLCKPVSRCEGSIRHEKNTCLSPCRKGRKERPGRKGQVIIFPVSKSRITVVVVLFHSIVLKQCVAKLKVWSIPKTLIVILYLANLQG